MYLVYLERLTNIITRKIRLSVCHGVVMVSPSGASQPRLFRMGNRWVAQNLNTGSDAAPSRRRLVLSIADQLEAVVRATGPA